MSPTKERLAVYLWLNLINERLPNCVARIYVHELATKLLKDIQPQLSQAMDSLLTELATQIEIQVHFTRSSRKGNRRQPFKQNASARQSSVRQAPKSTFKSCSVCKAVGRAHETRDRASCWYLHKFEKLEIVMTLRVSSIQSDNEDEFG